MGRSTPGWVEKELYRGDPKLHTFNSHCKGSLCQDRMHTVEDSMPSWGADEDVRLFQRSWGCLGCKFIKRAFLLILILNPQNIQVPKCFFWEL